MPTHYANIQNNKRSSSFPNTPQKTTEIDPTSGLTIAYGEDIVPDWTMDMGDTGQKYIVPRSDFDEGNYSKAQKINAPKDGEYDYGSKFVMRGNKITGNASDKDVMNYPEHISGKKAGDLGDQMMNWARQGQHDLTYDKRKAEADARYKAIKKAEKKEARKELGQIRRENRN